jgi:hypothetical protein
MIRENWQPLKNICKDYQYPISPEKFSEGCQYPLAGYNKLISGLTVCSGKGGHP